MQNDLKISLHSKIFKVFLMTFLLVTLLCLAQEAFADVAIGGTDNTQQMKDLQNLLTTIQIIGFKWVAKVIGGFLIIAGIYKIASRDFMNGILATVGGGTLFFVEKIADSLAKMGS